MAKVTELLAYRERVREEKHKTLVYFSLIAYVQNFNWFIELFGCLSDQLNC